MQQPTPLNDILSAPVKRSLSEEVVVRLREAIINGRIAAGDRLREESLAASMSVSRGPVREALQRLEREGLVIVHPNRGATVARLSREDVDEVHSLRLALERLAVVEAIRHATGENLATMAAIIDEMIVSSAVDISGQLAAELDTRFHQALVEASGHRRLIRSWHDLQPQIHIFLLSRTVANADFREHLVNSHTNILNAIRDRDESRAIAVIEDHIRGAYSRVKDSYPSE